MAASPQPEIALEAPLSAGVVEASPKPRAAAGAATSAPIEPGPLSHIPLFSMLDTADQRILFESMRVENVPAHQTIFWRGDRGDSMYLISSGQVSISVPSDAGEHVVLDYLGPGGFFGEI